MSTTPAAELAATRTRWPMWSIRPVVPGRGTGFTAYRHGSAELARVWAPTLGALEERLRRVRKPPAR
jgi:hypothetical protein